MARAVINCRILPGEPPAEVEAVVRRLAGDRVKVSVLAEAVTSPPSAVPPAFLARIERLVAAEWPALPVVPVMEAGATDGLFTRRAGIPTYALSAIPEDLDDIRAHGKDERIRADAFDQAVEFWYRLVKSFGDS
jgi:acetylornithine deacetylase/succinyl-diaminopimelate desuccinylase-like protein